jgi:hypothetical protein
MENLNNILSSAGITTRQESTEELLAKFKLNWTVEKQNLILPDGTPTPFYGVVRSDNKAVFATCKEGYQEFQNSELLDLVNESAGKLGLDVSRGGLFKGGALVYLQLSTGKVSGIGLNNDSIDTYVSAMNSHDGTLSLKWGLTNVTISCKNSFWRAVGQMQNSVRHTQSMKARIELMIKDIQNAQEAEKNLYKMFFKFAEVPMSKQQIVDVTKMVVGVDMAKQTSDDITTYQKNRLADLASAIAVETKEKGETLWGLFSGVTKYTTHHLSGSADSRNQSKAVGMGYRIDNIVFDSFAEVLK